MKILVRGGSISSGCGVARSYVDILRSHYASRALEVVNRSRANETSFDGVETFDEDIARFRPEYLVVHFGIDDAFSAVYRSEFKENLVRITRRAQAMFDPLIFLATSHSFDNEHDMAAVNIYYRTIRDVSNDLQCEFIPVHIYWAGYLLGNGLPSSDFVQEDNRCPNEKGHEIFARAMIRSLDRYLPPESD